MKVSLSQNPKYYEQKANKPAFGNGVEILQEISNHAVKPDFFEKLPDSLYKKARKAFWDEHKTEIKRENAITEIKTVNRLIRDTAQLINLSAYSNITKAEVEKRQKYLYNLYFKTFGAPKVNTTKQAIAFPAVEKAIVKAEPANNTQISSAVNSAPSQQSGTRRKLTSMISSLMKIKTG
jgi:hypothetical protein